MNGPGFDERDLDRLVDGELDEATRRRLLTQLEQTPDGWRRCALAFLEAQAWHSALRVATESKAASVYAGDAVRADAISAALGQRRADATGVVVPSTSTAAATAVPPKTSRNPLLSLRTWVNTMAMAACFLIALNIGLHWRGASSNASRGVRQEATQRTSVITPDSQSADSGWRTVTIAVPDATSGGTAQIQLPCRESERLDEQWLHSLPGAISPEVRRALERNGYQVRQQRQLVPLPLEDGRRLVVPIDQVELRFVGNDVY